VVIVIIRLEFGENIDKLANPPRRQRPACIEQGIVIDDPGLGFGQFVRRCIDSNDLGDGNVVDRADGLDNVVPCQALQGCSDLVRFFVTPFIEGLANANQPDLCHSSSVAEENLTKQNERSSAVLHRAPASSDTATSLCVRLPHGKRVLLKRRTHRVISP
jgi:hypothetical protein